jgi:hypothetical protein
MTESPDPAPTGEDLTAICGSFLPATVELGGPIVETNVSGDQTISPEVITRASHALSSLKKSALPTLPASELKNREITSWSPRNGANLCASAAKEARELPARLWPLPIVGFLPCYVAVGTNELLIGNAGTTSALVKTRPQTP